MRSFSDQADELSTFALRNVSRDEVLKEISRLRSDFSTGINQILVKFVKLASDYLSGPLTYTINSCINTSSFPKTWKTARVSPIPKVDNPIDCFHDPIMQYVLGGSLHKNNTIYLPLRLYHASVN